jgi:hypothetical protein
VGLWLDCSGGRVELRNAAGSNAGLRNAPREESESIGVFEVIVVSNCLEYGIATKR